MEKKILLASLIGILVCLINTTQGALFKNYI